MAQAPDTYEMDVPVISPPTEGAKGRWHMGLLFEQDAIGCNLLPNVYSTKRLAKILVFVNCFVAFFIFGPLYVFLTYTNGPVSLILVASSSCAVIAFTAVNAGYPLAFRYHRKLGTILEYDRSTQTLRAPRIDFSIRMDAIDRFHLVRGTYPGKEGRSQQAWQLFLERQDDSHPFVQFYSFQLASYDKRAIEQFAHEIGRVPVIHTSAPFLSLFKITRKKST